MLNKRLSIRILAAMLFAIATAGIEQAVAETIDSGTLGSESGVVGGVSSAQSSSSNQDGWQFEVTPFYLWAQGGTGDVTVRGFNSEVDFDFKDALEGLEFAFTAHLEARNGPFTILSDYSFMALGAANQVADADIDVSILELAGAYRVAGPIELLAGARYFHIKGALIGKGSLGLSAEGNQEWVDPIVGARLTQEFLEKWAFIARTDIGGFGAGSDFAWNLLLALDYRLTERASLKFGYRLLDVDYDDGAGRDLFEYDVLTTGPGLGLTLHF